MKVAAVQMDIVWEEKEKNRKKCLAFLEKAQKQNAELILFPEMTLTGFSMNIDAIGEINDETTDWFKNKAREFGLYIGFGHVQKTSGTQEVPSKGRNLFSMVSPEGIEIARYAKIHPFSFGMESRFYEGGSELVLARVKDFQVAPLICYDLRFPEIFQILSAQAQLIIVAANWPKSRREHWITLLKARAIENQCYIAGVNRVGRGGGLEYAGDSMIIDPTGTVISREVQGEGLLISDMEVKKVQDIREAFRVKDDRQEVLYASYYKKGRKQIYS